MDGSTFVRDSWDLIDTFGTVADLDTFRNSLADHFAICGVEHFVIFRVPPPGQDSAAALFLVDRWPKDWLSYYDEQKFVRHDPITARLLSSVDPFAWANVAVDRRDEPTAFRIMNEAKEIGMIEGLSIPIFDPSGFQGCISMCGRRLDTRPDTKRALHMVSLFAHGTAERLHDMAEDEPSEPLTAREREVLRWTAIGKHQSEIGDILGVSWRTVETHLRNARRKMRAVNTTHATVVALRRREIRL